MSTTTAHPLPDRSVPTWGPGRVLVLVGGSLLALIALLMAMAGIALVLAHATARDSAGFYTSSTERFATQTYALTSEGLQIGDVRGQGADWALDCARCHRPRAGVGPRRGSDVHRHRPRVGPRSLPDPGRARGGHRRPLDAVQL